MDPDLVLDDLAYDLDAAVLESVRQSTALDAKGMESITQDAEEDDRVELEDEDDVVRELEDFQVEETDNSLLEMKEDESLESTVEDLHSIPHEPITPFTPSALHHCSAIRSGPATATPHPPEPLPYGPVVISVHPPFLLPS